MADNDLTASPKQLPENAFDRLKKKLEVMGYTGVPLHQNFMEVQGTGDIRHRYGVTNLHNNPIVGGRLRYNTDNPNLAFDLDVQRYRPDIMQGQPNVGGRGFKQSIMRASPSVVGKVPLGEDGSEAWAGMGPTWVHSQQGDHTGWSPPSDDIGFNAFAGLKKQLNDRWGIFGEGRYNYSNITPHDQQGAFKGSLSDFGLLGGITYKLGVPDK